MDVCVLTVSLHIEQVTLVSKQSLLCSARLYGGYGSSALPTAADADADADAASFKQCVAAKHIDRRRRRFKIDRPYVHTLRGRE